MTSSAPLDGIAQAIARADYLLAYELCAGLTDEQRNALDPVARLRVDYYQCLALARGGSGAAATSTLRSLRRRTAAAAPEHLPPDLEEDVAALEARIAKDTAFRRSGLERQAAASEAARLYEAVYERLGRPYACINAATMLAIAAGSDAEMVARSKVLAAEALERAESDDTRNATDADRYWQAATRAEALAVLGDLPTMTLALHDAAGFGSENRSARSTTVRQLAVLFEVLGIDATLLDVLRNPPVLHYCGHRVSADESTGRLPGDAMAEVVADIKAFLGAQSFSAAYGALASGADIVTAEACLERGIDLHVVLPFAPDEFAEVSVADSGADWIDRFWRCIDQATSVGTACDDEYLGDDILFGHAANLAMGEALNRANLLAADAIQLAVWDGVTGPKDAGTFHDIEVWRSIGKSTHIIDSRGRGTQGAVGAGDLSREIRAVVFGDLKGYSRLHDRNIRAFQANVMAPLAQVLRDAGDGVLVAQTWGDGLKVIFADVVAAASVALEIQAVLGDIDLEAAGLPSDFGLRLSGHVGPLLPIIDAVSGLGDYAGRVMTHAARIEPRTPEGEVYVTGEFAALLALHPDTGVTPEYVGTITTARDFETIPVYVLTRNC